MQPNRMFKASPDKKIYIIYVFFGVAFHVTVTVAGDAPGFASGARPPGIAAPSIP